MVHLVEDREGIYAKGKKMAQFITPFLVNATLSVGQGPQPSQSGKMDCCMLCINLLFFEQKDAKIEKKCSK
jgi:hypothetical protein